ncbi:MAG: hypothetical protein R3F55_24580 [Alphaproteobacteria bacterium]
MVQDVLARLRHGFVAAITAVVVLPATAPAQDSNQLIVLSPDRAGALQIASQSNMVPADVVKLLDCIFLEMGLTYQMAPMPPRRAELMFANGVASAILDNFQGQLPDLPSYAAPIMPQEWAWFFPAASALRHDDMSFQDQASIAVPGQYGLKQHMSELGFRSVAEATSEAQLVQLLQYGRVDAVLAPAATFRQAMSVLGIADTMFRSEVQATWHLVVRFRDEYAVANPDVVAEFAQARVACAGR